MRRSRRQAGVTLVELMVALAIGLGIVLTAGRLLVLANGAYAAQVESGTVDDGGRFAADLIGRAVRQAGAADVATLADPASDAAPARLAGLDARTLSRTAPGMADPLPGAVNGSDVLAIRFPGADGAVDCAGFPAAAGEEGWSIFYVARNGEGEAELRCKYRGAAHWSADAVVSGVDGFQVLYAVDTDDPPDGVANRYLNAAAVDALDAALAGLGTAEFNHRTHWKRVVGVRVGLLLHGSRPTRAAPGSTRYDLLGAGYADAAGADDPGSSLDEARMTSDLRRRERRLFTFTVALPAPPS
ncbi:PilW family protein [Massilia rhizosphaerae]|uniref:PilW family protein n=1 Tax=Massilia rhizosphaerae TaxID=2784389 RepID=UPI0018DD732A|nr:PilW family protein [Massilia rhizosphaerae]